MHFRKCVEFEMFQMSICSRFPDIVINSMGTHMPLLEWSYLWSTMPAAGGGGISKTMFHHA